VGQIAAFVVVSAVVIVTPGQDTALTIRNTLAGAKRGGVTTAFGVAAGQAVWTLATCAGLAAAIAASEPLFRAIKLAGAAYLVVLGLLTLRDATRRRFPRRDVPAARVVASRAFRQGLLSNLGNPKMAVFFTSLLPQFGGSSFTALLALSLVFCTMTLGWLSAYAVVVARAGDVLRRASIRRALELTMGAILIAVGARLATDRR